MKALILSVLCLATTLVMGDFLVLRDGKIMEIPGKYEVIGKFVRFKGGTGDVLQLPAKLVDLEKSAAYTELKRKEEEERQKRIAEAEPKPEVPNRALTLSEIAEAVENQRPEDEPPPDNLGIGGRDIQKFAEKNPAPVNNSAPITSSSGDQSYEAVQEERQNFRDQYQEVLGQIKEIDGEIEKTEAQITTYQNYLQEGGDHDSTAYDNMERLEKKLEELRKNKETKEKELKMVKRSARDTGFNGIDRQKRGAELQRKKEKKDDQQ